jgi:hypothetical protein
MEIAQPNLKQRPFQHRTVLVMLCLILLSLAASFGDHRDVHELQCSLFLCLWKLPPLI